EDRQAGTDQGDELLIEDQELLEAELAAEVGGAELGELAPRLDGIDEEALFDVALPQPALVGRRLDALVDSALGVGVLQQELGHRFVGYDAAGGRFVQGIGACRSSARPGTLRGAEARPGPGGPAARARSHCARWPGVVSSRAYRRRLVSWPRL